ncbi:MAG: PD-(D/E)XK nuclease family protein [Bacteroidales bacterium]|nr:PD-(D/E)XK nuclease family protein [Bacteroidales bacterium]
MDTFLESVAQRILHEHPRDMGQVTIIFNNRRAGLFLRRQFAQMQQHSTFLPRIIGIDDLVAELGGLQIVPHEFLLFDLFDIYKHNNIPGNRKFDSFEDFISFGELMLSDFAEIDLYMVDAKSIFENLKEWKELCEWNPDETQLNDYQRQYLDFYRSLHYYYSVLRERLGSKGQAYAGMAYRHVAEEIDTLLENQGIETTPDRVPTYYFVGFNALSTSEKKIIDCYLQRGTGALIFDGDDYYSQEEQEAGLFQREIMHKYHGNKQFGEHFKEGEHSITIVNCPEKILQAKETGLILKEIADSMDDSNERIQLLTQTAVVLADETLLLPMLNALPQKIDKANVTMGFPYTLSNIHALAIKLLSLYSRAGSRGYYHTDVLEVLADSIIDSLLETKNLRSLISSKIDSGKLIYLSPEQVSELLAEVTHHERIDFLFSNPQPDANMVLSKCLRLLEQLVTFDSLRENIKETEAAGCFAQTIKYLIELQDTYHYIEKVSTLEKIYQRLSQRRTLSFIGEPLTGLQCLGMLETRSLDFKNVILLSVNEGVVPAGRSSNTLIPLSIKKANRLPTYEEKDAVYAYHFYRLLQRAEKVWLLYSSDAHEMGKGEPSRFILQIKNELTQHYPNIHIEEEVASAAQLSILASDVSHAPKDEKTMAHLQDFANYGFSPSALNNYRNCPLKFYYENILGIKKNDEVEDEVENNELGSLIHAFLDKTYRGAGNQPVNAEMLEEALRRLNTELDNIFAKEVLKGRDKEGKNHLLREVARMQIAKFLEKEVKEIRDEKASITIEQLELMKKLPLTLTDGRVVNIRGQADRIDRYNGRLRVIDYKSGKVKHEDLECPPKKNKQELPLARAVSDKWFQVMTYAWLFCRGEQCEELFQTGIYPLQAINEPFIPAQWNGNSKFGTSEIDAFEQLLVELIDEMMNPAVDFIAQPKEKACTYCPMHNCCQPLKDDVAND